MKIQLLFLLFFVHAVCLNAQWSTSIILDSNNYQDRRHSSLEAVDGNPAVSYVDNSLGHLKYIRATTPTGTFWSIPITIFDNTYYRVLYTCLKVVSGHPAISYYDGQVTGLAYVRANDVKGNTWGPPIHIDVVGNTGHYTSMAIVDGHPAIAYHATSGKDLKYVRANDSLGTSWGTPIIVEHVGDVGRHASLVVVNDHPAIAYFDRSKRDVKYVRASNATGSSWNTPVVVDAQGTVGYYTSMAVVNGHPAISYYDSSDKSLTYVRASDANGNTWGTPVVADNIKGDHTSLAVVDGFPAISYYRSGPQDLKYVRANDANGNTWGVPILLDDGPNTGQQSSLAVINGTPAISYNADRGVRYIFSNTSTGRSNTWNMSGQSNSNTNILVYPNPITQNMLTIQLPEKDDSVATITLYDLAGRIVKRTKTQQQQATLYTSSITKGVYIVEVHINGYIQREKVLLH